VFDTEVLEEALEILGAPVVEIELESNRPVAMVAVRLSDVRPDGQATRVSYGVLNLTHRDSHEFPEPPEPGKRYTVRLQMNEIAQRFPAGNRIRLSLSTVYWPLAWPSPEPVRLTMYASNSQLNLPLRPPRTQDTEIRHFDPPEAARPPNKIPIRPARRSWTVVRDLAADESRLEIINNEGVCRFEDIDLEVETEAAECYVFQGDDYESLRGETRWVRRFKRNEWEVRTVTRTVLTSNVAEFRIRADLDAYEGDTRVYSKSWDERIERDLV
jgi:hypothetical protein